MSKSSLFEGGIGTSNDAQSVPRLFAALAHQAQTGSLEIWEGDSAPAQAFFLNGVPQGALVQRSEYPIGRCLIELGLLSDEELEDAIGFQSQANKLLGQLLQEMGLVSDEEIIAGSKYQYAQNLKTVVRLQSGRFRFSEGLVHLQGFAASPSPTFNVIYEGMTEVPNAANLPEKFVEKMTFAHLRILDLGNLAVDLLGPAEKVIAQMLQDFKTVSELAHKSPMKPRDILWFLYSLYLTANLETRHPSSLSA